MHTRSATTATLRPLCLHRSVLRYIFRYVEPSALAYRYPSCNISIVREAQCLRYAPLPRPALSRSMQRCPVSSKRRVPGLSTRADPNPPTRGPCSACPLCAQCTPDFGIHPRRMRRHCRSNAQCTALHSEQQAPRAGFIDPSRS